MLKVGSWPVFYYFVFYILQKTILILSIFVFIKRTSNKAINKRINTQKCNGFYIKKNISQFLQNIFQFYFDFKLTIKPFFPSFIYCFKFIHDKHVICDTIQTFSLFVSL